MDGKTLNGKCLYTPQGAAREYAAVGCNLYRGCPYRCNYCYNRKGLAAGILGLDHAVLSNAFTDMRYRPKKYAAMTPEEYALHVLTNELARNWDYLKQTGIFMSFTTDPFCLEAFTLTSFAITIAIEMDIPVKVLTKNAELNFLMKEILLESTKDKRDKVAIGYTLTGRDREEPFASPNKMRIEAMKWMKGQGFRTFASIEPIVDFDSSYKMIERSIGCADQYLIGLMSNRGSKYPPYVREECAAFIHRVDELLETKGTASKVYWKQSMKRFMACDDLTMGIMERSSRSVNMDWCLFNQEYSLTGKN